MHIIVICMFFLFGGKMDFIIGCLPIGLSKAILEHNTSKMEEIRIRAERPVILKIGVVEVILKYVVKQNEIMSILQSICSNSIYAYQNQICNGFITLPGGHRVRYMWKCCYKRRRGF